METEIKQCEEKLRKAMLHSDVAALEILLSEKLLFNNHLGGVMSKAQDLEGHRSGFAKIHTLELSEMQVIPQETFAVVTVLSSITGTFGGQESSGTFRFMRVWAQEEGEWRVVAGQSTLVAS